jgi:hypothetical protein
VYLGGGGGDDGGMRGSKGLHAGMHRDRDCQLVRQLLLCHVIMHLNDIINFNGAKIAGLLDF